MFKHLREDEIERIARKWRRWAPCSRRSASGCSRSSTRWPARRTRWRAAASSTPGRSCRRALSPDVARRILDRLAQSFESTAGFSALENADPQQLSKFILGEHPQTIALILAHLNAANAAQLVALLPDALRADVLTRMANLDEISPEVISEHLRGHRRSA